MVKIWSKEEDSILIELYGKVTNTDLAKVLVGRTEGSVYKRANGVLKLSLPKNKIDMDYLIKLRQEIEG